MSHISSSGKQQFYFDHVSKVKASNPNNETEQLKREIVKAIFDPLVKTGRVGSHPALTDLLCMGDNSVLPFLLGVDADSKSKGFLQELVSQIVANILGQEFSLTAAVIGISSYSLPSIS